MRFVVYGAGAIGGLLGGKLALAGNEVVLIARGAHLEAIRRDGMRIESPDGIETVAIQAVGDPGELDWRDDDVVLLSVKSQDTRDALATLAFAANPVTAVVSLQNGVANERAALRLFENVYGVCVMCPAEHMEPGVVVAQCSPLVGLLDIGRYPSGSDDRARAIAAAFETSDYQSVVRDDVMRWKYAKLLLNLGNVVQAVCAPKTGRRKLTERARAEGRAVLEAAGIAFVPEEEDAERRGDLLQMKPVSGRTRGGSSTWQSLARGTGSLETDWLNGEIVLLGREHGVPTPVNAALQELGQRAVRERLAPETVPASDLLDMLPDDERRRARPG